jgi:hypothetical protein
MMTSDMAPRQVDGRNDRVRIGLMSHALPVFDFFEEHRILIQAPSGRILDKVTQVDPANDPFIRLAVTLRELPSRIAERIGDQKTGLSHSNLSLADFIDLGRDDDREVAFGLAGRFWRLDYGLARLKSTDEFVHWSEPGAAKLVMGFAARPCAQGVWLVTRTEILCLDRKARREFLPYWLLIRPVSGLIRRRWLRRIKTAAEASR